METATSHSRFLQVLKFGLKISQGPGVGASYSVGRVELKKTICSKKHHEVMKVMEQPICQAL